MKLSIAYFYPKELNLYGDNGNVEILTQRAKARNYEVDILNIDSAVKMTSASLKDVNLVFMGGGPDSGQKGVYRDLLEDKKGFLAEYVENGGASLFICGAYQLMGKYYRSYDGTEIEGLGIFDMYTENPGTKKDRCVGNIIGEIKFSEKPVFRNFPEISNTLVGFENHGGRTYLNESFNPFAYVKKGYGNNGEDGTEGVFYNNSIGTYLHGPLLSKNPHIADFLIASALKIDTLPPLDDKIITHAHSALIKRFS